MCCLSEIELIKNFLAATITHINDLLDNDDTAEEIILVSKLSYALVHARKALEELHD